MALPVIAFIAVLFVGFSVALETPTNALLGKTGGSFLQASLISFVVGAIVLGIITLVVRPRGPDGWVQATPWYAWTGGFYGAFIVVASAWATPKLGAGTTLVAMVAAQVLLGVILDHFGVLGLPHHTASWVRIGGIILVAAGAALVARG